MGGSCDPALRGPDGLARPCGNRPDQARRHGADRRQWRRLSVRIAVRKGGGATIYATSSSPEKAGRLRELGATRVIDYRLNQDWGRTVAQLSGGGVDHVIDVGGAATLKQSIAATRVDGNLVLIGMLGGNIAELDLIDVMLKQQRIRPIAVENRAMQERMIGALETTQMKPIIDRVFPLARSPMLCNTSSQADT